MSKTFYSSPTCSASIRSGASRFKRSRDRSTAAGRFFSMALTGEVALNIAMVSEQPVEVQNGADSGHSPIPHQPPHPLSPQGRSQLGVQLLEQTPASHTSPPTHSLVAAQDSPSRRPNEESSSPQETSVNTKIINPRTKRITCDLLKEFGPYYTHMRHDSCRNRRKT